MRASTPLGGGECRAPLLEECPQHQGPKGDTGVTPGPCGAVGEGTRSGPSVGRDPGRWRRLSSTETRSHKGMDMRMKRLMSSRFQNAKEHLNWRCELKVMKI